MDVPTVVVAHYVRCQRRYEEMAAEIHELIEKHPDIEFAHDQLTFLADRHDDIQKELDSWRDAQSMAECLRRLPGVPGMTVEKGESDGEG